MPLDFPYNGCLGFLPYWIVKKRENLYNIANLDL